MPEETQIVEAAPSSAPVAEATIEIPRSNTPEYAEWRTSGKLPDKKEPNGNADPATADPSKETPSEPAKAEAAPDPESGTKQETRKAKPVAEARINELTARTKQLERELEEARKPTKTQAEPAPSRPQQPQNYQEWRQGFKAQDWISKYAESNPEASYEDAQVALGDYVADARDHFKNFEQTRTAQAKAFDEAVNEARARYENFDEVVQPAATAINTSPDIPQSIKDMFIDSDVLPDLLFTIGSDAAELERFMKMAKDAPTKASRYLAKVEMLIEDQLAKPRNEKGQFSSEEAPKTPAKRGPESAPAPPLEIGSRGSGAKDDSERALQAIERGDGRAVSAFFEAENRKDMARRLGR